LSLTVPTVSIGFPFGQASSIATLLDTVKQTIDAMVKQWTEAYAAWGKRLKELVAILNKQEREGFEANPRDEFLALLSCGLATAGLHQFLTGAMGEQGVKRLSRTMDVASELHLVVLCLSLLTAFQMICAIVKQKDAALVWTICIEIAPGSDGADGGARSRAAVTKHGCGK
jgi:hypothetical protein